MMKYIKNAVIVLTFIPMTSLAQDLDLGIDSYPDWNAGLNAYEEGDFVAALKNWRTIAEQGDTAGQVGLAILYSEGKGVAQDYAEAARWYHLAADQGDMIAQESLGFMYYQGDAPTVICCLKGCIRPVAHLALPKPSKKISDRYSEARDDLRVGHAVTIIIFWGWSRVGGGNASTSTPYRAAPV